MKSSLITPWALRCLPLVGVSLLVACTPRSSEDWFPLQKGARYDYAVTQTGADTESTQQLNWQIELTRIEQRDGRAVYVRHHSEGVEFHLLADEKGVRRIATRLEIDQEATPDADPRWVLKAPYVLGTEWTTPTVPFFLMRKNEYPRELKNTHQALMTWTIASVDESVETQAGKFHPCMRLEGLAHLNLYTDPVNGFNDVPLLSREWYCRGVGLVKFERIEKVPAGFMTGGTLQAELTSWR
ncbi:MAG: hypothetical protein RLZZ591_432 [Pseudomonadota bacterium]|jgi:hypothetical protein